MKWHHFPEEFSEPGRGRGLAAGQDGCHSVRLCRAADLSSIITPDGRCRWRRTGARAPEDRGAGCGGSLLLVLAPELPARQKGPGRAVRKGARVLQWFAHSQAETLPAAG
ncbi:hypothetical protein NDU88_002140 [Pleurodeles waltl]|uniref:Uncharacterized protein n=1 Tax=Pleurodeles waltl TaxID=8319 RepID=A0AAV7WKE3_PLEWA|nr:hypothetical protein NDU88_002140 [Pleurodeles waltl]